MVNAGIMSRSRGFIRMKGVNSLMVKGLILNKDKGGRFSIRCYPCRDDAS